ncbi:Shedu anti-phage system protein SduA domain-containing protein [Acinetobacter baumannii]|uniref:Shedu anti-phage system protein SduA domain-containing protein n=1 Tax=Acinetobacter baumannii TaxID=470 RepID=UPI0023404851|nr:Shedu anti-phage system protein SduA domain-containing protein [Acinetobacter baumannii]MDC5397669.1 DUF4263 domain-containing protein [Acinetobacter baumannii]MDK2172316.1 DUF4263 domain-containing protein [Acinetobacter baumannii]MDK2183136.1 DUF4263 domain-containing protein [Acinetobacter baumannii]MDK2329071.1 DUF4263 domain-containing protein [Acinetobacter baumannii]WGQ06593.1 DUF4263 domain-containing protein [Acinetobacter baumannii]
MYHEKVESFKRLLDADENEQVYQNFIEENSEFLPRHFMQNHGIHLQLFLRKLPLSSEYISDFFFMSKSTDDWHYVMVEIEKPKSKFFKEGSNDLHRDFLAAVDQIKSWKAWFSQTANKSHFEQQLAFLKKPITNTPVYMKYILVFGRRSEIEESDLRLSRVKSYEDDDFKIMTFDSLCEDIARKYPLYKGVKKSGYIEIHNENVLEPEMFSWVQPNEIQIKQALKDNLLLSYQTTLDSINNSERPLKALAKSKYENLINKVSHIRVF